jgi:diaminopimelate decarboxylase
MRTAFASRLTPAELGKLEHPTPYLLLDLDAIQDAYHALTDALPEVAIRYAVKCNPDPRILARLPRPRPAVYVRLAAPRLGSTVPSEGKFGIDPDHAVDLLQAARSLGLRPYGIAFHVGSPDDPAARLGSGDPSQRRGLRALQTHRIILRMLDIGGGFPARYAEPIPDLADYGACIRQAVQRHLPYPIELVAEPGPRWSPRPACWSPP